MDNPGRGRISGDIDERQCHERAKRSSHRRRRAERPRAGPCGGACRAEQHRHRRPAPGRAGGCQVRWPRLCAGACLCPAAASHQRLGRGRGQQPADARHQGQRRARRRGPLALLPAFRPRRDRGRPDGPHGRGPLPAPRPAGGGRGGAAGHGDQRGAGGGAAVRPRRGLGHPRFGRGAARQAGGGLRRQAVRHRCAGRDPSSRLGLRPDRAGLRHRP